MANYGLTNAGYKLKRLETIIEEMKADFLTKQPNANVSDDSAFGSVFNTTAKPLADDWERGQGVYESQYPSGAQGNSLDDIGEINAITRLGKKKSTVIESFTGNDGITIPVGTQIRRPDSQNVIFQTLLEGETDDKQTTRTNCSVVTVLNNHDYVISIDLITVTYISDPTATIEEITNGIVDKVNLDPQASLIVDAFVEVAASGTFYLLSKDKVSAFTLDLTADFTLDKFWTPLRMEALTFGEIEAPATTLTEFITPVAGVEATNFTDAIIGRETQPDQTYRQRLFTEQRRLGGGNLEAIRFRILNEVDDVVLVKAFENDTMAVVDSRPPKSIELVVEGGINQEIADELWLAKGGGIETYGTVSENVTDSNGDTQIVKFSRPTPQYIWVKIQLTVDSNYPADGDTIIKENIVEQGRSIFTIGSLIITQEFYCPIFAVDGVVTVSLLEIAVTDLPTDTPTYQTANIQLAAGESPLFDLARVEVTQV